MASFESFIHERVVDDNLEFEFCSARITRPVDSPPELEKPVDSSETETELEIDIIPLKQFAGALRKEQDKIVSQTENEAKYL